MSQPAAIAFTMVQRPGKAKHAFPTPLANAIARTLTNGQAVRVDVSTWSQNRAQNLYRAAMHYGKTTPYAVIRNRTKTELLFWAEERKHAATNDAP